jgi:hypothetical protein
MSPIDFAQLGAVQAADDGKTPSDPHTVQRDRYDRPLIVKPQDWPSGKATPFTRMTTFIAAIETAEGLAKWREAMVFLGAARNPKALLDAHVRIGLTGKSEPWLDYKRVKALELADGTTGKSVMWEAINALKEAAGIDEASAYGTLVHDATEEWERHEGSKAPAEIIPLIEYKLADYERAVASCGSIPDRQRTADRLCADLAGYARARASFSILAVEKFVAIPELEAGGTLDRHIGFDGQVFTGDLKTGDSAVAFPGKLALQLAGYTLGRPYSRTDGWDDLPYVVNRTWGLVLHFPGDGQCVPMWVKIGRAMSTLVELIPKARAWEKYAGSQRGGRPALLKPFEPGAGVPQVDAADEIPPFQLPDPDLPVPTSPLVAAIRAAQTRDELVQLWTSTDGEHWPDELVELSKVRAAELAERAVSAQLGAEVIADTAA